MVTWVEYVDPQFEGLNMTALNIDEAYLRINSMLSKTIWIYTLSKSCFSCPYTKFHKVVSNINETTRLDVTHPLSIQVFDNDHGLYVFDNNSSFCKLEYSFGEFGVYDLDIFMNKTCTLTTKKVPVNIYLSLALMLIIITAVVFGIKAFGFIRKRINLSNEQHEEQKEVNTKKRLNSLDAFRGLTIILMIFVNSGGGKYWWIEHAPWNGLHIADIVFPFFLWIMGVCIPISVISQLNHGVTKIKLLKRIFWRSVKLFLIGLCLNSINGPNLEKLRIMGVLQRFGIAYCIVGFIYTIHRNNNNLLQQTTRFTRTLVDMYDIRKDWIYSIFITLTSVILLFTIPAPGCPVGYVGPGGKYGMAKYFNCTGGFAGYFDRIILGQNHIYQHSTAKPIYNSQAFDPEGIFGCLLTIFQVFLGVQCGSTIINFDNWKQRVKRWILWSIILFLLGGILCNFSIESGWIPVNKNLWPLSYVLITSSLAFAIFSLLNLTIDVYSIWNGSTFVYAGMNSIIMYVGQTVLHKALPWHWKIGLMNTHFMLLLESVWNTALWMIIAFILFRKRIFYRI